MGRRIYREAYPRPETEHVDAPEGVSRVQFARKVAEVEAEADKLWSKEVRRDGWTIFSTRWTDAGWTAVHEAVRRLKERV